MATLIDSPDKKTNNSKFFGEGLTFDDVLLMPAYSQVLPREVNIQSQLTKSLTLNVPILSAAMDTVTEAGLAIALAREGGLGILHKNMSIGRQAEHGALSELHLVDADKLVVDGVENESGGQ